MKCRINGEACCKAWMDPEGRCVDVRGPCKHCLLKMINTLEARLATAEEEVKQLRAIKCPPISDGDTCICPIVELEGEVEQLKAKIEAKCGTCSDFIEDEIYQFDTDGRCPHDSKAHKSSDCCDKWNVDLVEQAKEPE